MHNFYLKGVSNSKKYILIECQGASCPGWTNRLTGIMTAYAVSLLTNRSLVIKFDRPCSLTNYLIPNEINWNIDLPKNLTIIKFNIAWNAKYTKEIATNLLELNKDKDIIAFNVLADHISIITQVPKYHQRIKELGYKIGEFSNLNLNLYKWYTKLFKFTPSLEVDYQNFYKELKPTSNHKIICAQVRIGGKKDDKLFMHLNETANYWKFIEENLIFNRTTNKTLKDYRLFVTTDILEIVREAVDRFGRDKVVATKDIGGNIAKQFGIKKCSSLRYTFIEYFLLGKCDMALISQSGFGYYGIINRQDKNLQDFYVYNSNKRKIFKM